MKQMSDPLTDKEVETLVKLGEDIKMNLNCNINGNRFPCRTDRLGAVELMQEYLEIHNYKVV